MTTPLVRDITIADATTLGGADPANNILLPNKGRLVRALLFPQASSTRPVYAILGYRILGVLMPLDEGWIRGSGTYGETDFLEWDGGLELHPTEKQQLWAGVRNDSGASVRVILAGIVA